VRSHVADPKTLLPVLVILAVIAVLAVLYVLGAGPGDVPVGRS
jgi:hypothetical protein